MGKQLVGATEGSGDRIDWAEYMGKLVLIEPLEVEEGIKTKFTKPGEAGATAVRANVHVLFGPGKTEVLDDVLIFQRYMIGQLKKEIGKIVVGRVGQGEDNSKGNYPWIIIDPTEKDMANAGKYWASTSLSAPTPKERPAAKAKAAPEPVEEEAPWGEEDEDESY